ncbi:MAG: hypothetical protein F6K00_33625 [Leptolyngbya sp. SIOISBB]|nr:hypothetical protein [Leptolyngbya sp. SIOISBB]
MGIVMFNLFLQLSLGSVWIRRRLMPFLLGLVLVAGGHLLLHPSAFSQTSQDSPRFANTPEQWIEVLFEEAPDGVDTSYDFIAKSDGYAVIPYVWGEGGGFVVLEESPEGWSNLCGSGGGLDGGNFFVEFCEMSLIDAQDLWNVYRTEYNAAYGEEL